MPPSLLPSSLPISAIPQKPLVWLWQNRIPIGKLTLLAAHPGTGKTTLLLDLAARLSTGTPMPTDPPSQLPITSDQLLNPPASTLLLSPEDNIADTLSPKLAAAHANLDLIHILPNFHSLVPSTSPPSSPLQLLETTIQSIPNLALIIIDPITYYLGLTDKVLPHSPIHSARSTLHALAHLAHSYNLAIVLTTRLLKNPGPSLPDTTLHQILGSLAFAATTRSVLLLLPTPSRNPNRNPNPAGPPSPSALLLTIKSNCSSLPEPLALSIHDTVTWHPYSPPRTSPGPIDRITQSTADWLTSALAAGPVSAYTITEDAKKNAISRSTLYRAKDLLNVQSVKQDYSGKWFWFLPEDTRPLPDDPFARQIAQLLRDLDTLETEPEDLEAISTTLDREPENLAAKMIQQLEHLRSTPSKTP